VQTEPVAITNGIKDVFTSVLIDPLQALLSDSPWWLFAAVGGGDLVVIGKSGRRSSPRCVSRCSWCPGSGRTA